MKIYPVILSGGAGSRLWPLSREHYPKQLLPLVGEQSLLQDTVTRLDGYSGEVADVTFVCNEEHRFLVAEQMREIDRHPAAIILEPVGRNTAPALTLASMILAAESPDAVMLVMPADHVIEDRETFHASVIEGCRLAEKGFLVTFGVVPDKPETGYGYIKRGDPIEGAACKVDRFVEKPDAETARDYVANGDYFWNSGLFMMRADIWLEELQQCNQDIYAACKLAVDTGKHDADFVRVDEAAFSESPKDSIDYAVMENTKRAAVVPLTASWSDVGAWSSLWDVCQQDDNGNVTQGDVLTYDTTNAMLVAQHRCVATVGVDNVIVVETADAVLVARKDRAQDVKQIVNQLKLNERDEYKMHRRVFRPWGSYEGVDAGQGFQVKRLIVNPGASLSLQLHHRRAEHWIIVQGTALVTRGENQFTLGKNESTYIPLGVKHRLENQTDVPLHIIEVQSGDYLGEDDIVRFEDVYDRCAENS